ncbi:zonular occludens toxin domain-containing protein [Shewanella glacialipiscicola]|uniref:zonular occludens toxin domain-containing protein n=1 Tax=Shewanella glacialipiscicola TaxID=614069 RepID=UPI003D7B7285
MIYVVTGKLGSGKSLVAVGKIQEYLNQNRMVATNLDLYLEHLINPFSKSASVFRVPDKPTFSDLDSLPAPYEGEYDEKKTGLLVLDELGTWFNSRTWSDKGRAAVIDWFLHARKKGWDIIFIIQNVSMMDSQAREGLAELVVNCIRLDRFALPLVGSLLKLYGLDIRPPKFHVGFVRYGASPSAPLIERWGYSGRSLYNAYDTRQVFTDGRCGLYQYLPPHQIYGRYTNEREHFKRGFNKSFNRLSAAFSSRAAFFLGLFLSSAIWYFVPSDSVASTEQGQALKPNLKVETVTQSKSPLDGVSITASVKGLKSFTYVFQRGDDIFYPEHMDYRVRFVSECKAALLRGNTVDYVTCSPFISSSAVQPREGAETVREESKSSFSSSDSSIASNDITSSN